MSFDRLAPHYRWLEFLLAGEKLQRCRIWGLGQVRGSRRALVVGEGHGRFIEVFARVMPEARLTCVDASGAMLRQARGRWLRAGGDPARAEFIRAALPEWRPPLRSFDLIATHFFLDCFPPEQLELVALALSDAARPGARWLLSDFQIPAHGMGRVRARIILAAAYLFFRLVTRLPARQLTPPDLFLERGGFRLVCRRRCEWGLLHTDVWERSA